MLSVFDHPGAAHWLMVLAITLGIFCIDTGFLFILSHYFDPLKKRLAFVAFQKNKAGDEGGIAELLYQFARTAIPRAQEIYQKTRVRLSYAGYRSPDSLPIYYFIRLLLMVTLPVVALIISFFIPTLASVQIFGFMLASLMLGMIAPSHYLDMKAARCQRTLRRALPDAIDMLVVCTEAGLGLSAAVQRVAKELADFHPLLSKELLLITAEMRAGLDRNQAFMNMAERTGLEDIKGLVAILAQSMRFGTSIAQTLRAYAEDFRDKRMQKAEEEAGKLATKMIFPLVCCFFPVFFIVVLGPAAIKIMANMQH
jgi:tight adherence protein C